MNWWLKMYVVDRRFTLVKEHLIEFNQLAISAVDRAEGSHDMINRVMTKDNIALAALLETKPAFWQSGKYCSFVYSLHSVCEWFHVTNVVLRSAAIGEGSHDIGGDVSHSLGPWVLWCEAHPDHDADARVAKHCRWRTDQPAATQWACWRQLAACHPVWWSELAAWFW